MQVFNHPSERENQSYLQSRLDCDYMRENKIESSGDGTGGALERSLRRRPG
ncbi:uncharacterized protein FOMMEDRAFT_162653 [Fomitiporia mediterranea MF3/22]|uniref:Uncharacterized protein n=1 Tax=Fomitiporia mediterranea (strain MF3/22) TaxID=694068 RepID=R7SGT8_FOMME|nr:uncharacterized protein FOMMEDRAFT_162653 [Fomitiporia mediterranea MF3/22]EJC97630.1 hypothetical protein FOMMEDRAFT_162653 [Fomitiporia mediterranea MF3/22]